MASPIKIIQKLLEAEQQVADFIANGPDTGIQGYVRDRYRHRCRELANLPGWARALGVGRGPFTRVCEPYWDDNGWDGPVNPGPPFEGGQCDDVYTINYTLDTNASESTTGFLQARGPILGLVTTAISGTNTDISLRASGVNISGSPNCRSVANTGAGNYSLGSVITEGWGGATINSVTPCGVDNCGDPPDDPLIPGPNPPPDPGPLPGPEPFPDPRDPTGIPIVPIPPYEDPIFGPTPIEAPEDGPGSGGPPSGGDGLPGDPEAVSPSAGGAEGGEPGQDVDFGQPPSGRVWVGCIVTADVDPRYGTIPGTAPGNAVYPTTLGNASLIYDGFRGTSTRVLSEFTSLFRPVSSVVLTGCRVSSLPGVDLTVRPISAQTCPDNPCEESNG